MATIINASNSTGLTMTSDLSGILNFQANGSTVATVQPAGFSYPGAVLQVVQGTTNAATTTASTSPVTTGLTASITPKFSTSKILVISCYSLYAGNLNAKAVTSLYRNSTNLSAANGGAYAYTSSGAIQLTTGIQFLDSPATTSSTAYTIYLFTTAGAYNAVFNADFQNAYIILMEIAA